MNSISNLYKRRLLSSSIIIVDNKSDIKRLIRKRSRYINRFKTKFIKYLIR